MDKVFGIVMCCIVLIGGLFILIDETNNSKVAIKMAELGYQQCYEPDAPRADSLLWKKECK